MSRVTAVHLGIALLACVGGARAQLDVLSDVNEFPLVTGRAYAPQISGSGRFVLYRYWRGSTEGLTEQYVLIDLLTRTSTLVSVNDAGEPMNTGGLSTPMATSSASVSEDGRWVVFDSRSTNLVAGETSFKTRTYLRDTVQGTTRLLFDAGADVLSSPRGDRSLERIFVMRYLPGSSPLLIDFVLFERSSGETRNLFSVQFDDLIAPGFPRQPELSADGRYLVFATRTNGLVPQDQNDEHDVFRLDVESGVIVRVSEDANGLDSGSLSYSADISDDGRYVVFLSQGSNWLSAGSQFPAPNHAWRKDLQTGVLEPINTRGGLPFGLEVADATISGDGSTVAFRGAYVTDGLLENGARHVYRRQMFLPDAEMVDVNPQNQSSNGDCDLGAFEFPLSSNGFQFNPTLSTDGKRIAFSCAAGNLPPYTGFLNMDVFVRTYAGAPPLLSIPIPLLGGLGLGLLGLLCMAGGAIALRGARS